MQRPTARFVNGVISAIIVVFFIVHGMLGSFGVLAGFTSPFSWLVWLGMALVVAHILVSIITSYQQMTDAEFPPSARKKRHLVLKWVTGGLLAIVACAHIAAINIYGATALQASLSAAAFGVVLCAVLAIHLCVGSKSLLKDLEIDRRHKMAFRVVVCVVCAAIAIALLVMAR